MFVNVIGLLYLFPNCVKDAASLTEIKERKKERKNQITYVRFFVSLQFVQEILCIRRLCGIARTFY